MAKEVLFLVEDSDEGGYVARALGYSIFAILNDVADHLGISRQDMVQALLGK
jgi:hypothetical protein